MQYKLDIEATPRTPAVSFDFGSNRLTIKGESYPEDVTEFYAGYSLRSTPISNSLARGVAASTSN